MNAYVLVLALSSALFLYVVYQKIRNGQPLSTSLVYVPLLLGLAWLFYKLWADGQEIGKLHAQVEKAKENDRDLAEKAKQAVLDTEKRELETKLAASTVETGRAEEKLKIEEKRHAEVAARVARVQSWDDFWKAAS